MPLRVSMVRTMAVAACTLCLWLLSMSSAHAGNPDERWRTLESEHFFVHYAVGQEEAAERTAAVAERAYDNLSVGWSHRIYLKTHISLTDSTDVANGRATAVPFPNVVAHVTAPEALSVLGTYDDWLDVLITHELVHVVHLDTVHGIPRLINAVFGFGVLGKIISPNIVQPRWIIEGVATYEESTQTSAGRRRSAQFEMFLRTAVLSGRFQTIDQVSNGARLWPHGSSVYLYGLHFMHYIASRYGADKLTELSHIYAGQVVPLGINRAIKKVLGVDFLQLWNEFKVDTERTFQAQARRIRARGLRVGRRLTFSGETSRYPSWAPDDRSLLFYDDDGHTRAGIKRIDLEGAVLREGLGIGRQGTSSTLPLRVQVEGSTTAAQSPDGRRVVFDMIGQHDLRFGWSDLYVHEEGDPRKFRQLTFGKRAMEPHMGSDGRTVVFRRNDVAQSRLGFLDVATGDVTEVPARDRVAQVYSPRLSPDNTKVVYSGFRQGGFRDIYLYDRETGEERALTADRFQDLTPTWSPDGRHVVFTSDRDGVANLHAYDLETETVFQVSNVLGGAFEPAVSHDGTKIAYVGFDVYGYDIWVMDFDSDDWLPAVPAVAPRARAADPKPMPADGRPRTLHSSRYNPGRTFFPRTLFPTAFDVQSSGFGTELGLELGVSDVLGFHSVNGRFAYLLPPFNQPVGGVSYVFSRLFPTFIFSASRGFALRNGFTRYVYDYDQLNEESSTGYLVGGYRESIWAGDATMRVPIFRHPRYSVTGQVRYRYSRIRNMDESQTAADPNAPLSEIPETGDMGQVDVDIAYDSQTSARFGYSSDSGNRITFGATVIDRALGGDFGDLQIRASGEQMVKMPWRGHQVLALRGSGGASAGGIRRRGAFFVGGHPAEQDVFLSLLSRLPVSTGGVVRGYRQGQFSGRYFFVANVEYRIPVADVDRGIGTLPGFLRRIVVVPFFDVGSAWTEPLKFPDVRWGAGGSLVFSFRVGYLENVDLFLDYAHGFDEETGLNVFRALVARSF